MGKARTQNLTKRDKYLRAKYGITEKEYKEILSLQGGVCGICKKPPKPGRNFNVDHSHILARRGNIRQSVRGLLCPGRWWGCNRRLGKVDDPEWLIRAHHYLLYPPAKKVLGRQDRLERG